MTLLRANCLPSRARVLRGRSAMDKQCRAGFPETETPAHCVQRCFRTHGGSILRHNDIRRRVAGFLTQKGWTVEEEKAYRTSVGLRRPDLTVVKNGQAVVIDVQIVSSEGSLDEAHNRKVQKYESIGDLANLVADYAGVDHGRVDFSSLTISWRGIWSSASERDMRRYGLTTSQLKQLTTRALWGSWMNWKRFNGITTQYHRG